MFMRLGDVQGIVEEYRRWDLVFRGINGNRRFLEVLMRLLMFLFVSIFISFRLVYNSCVRDINYFLLILSFMLPYGCERFLCYRRELSREDVSFLKRHWFGVGLVELTVPRNYTHIGISAFGRCERLSVVRLSDELEVVGIEAFYGCPALREVLCSENSNLQEIGYGAFASCGNLERVRLPRSIEDSIPESAFRGSDNVNIEYV